MVKTAALLPAAGASARLGQPKQLLRLAGVTLVQRAVDLARAAGCARVVVVEGAVPLEVEHATVVRCEGWAAGPGASLKRGLQALAPDEAALVLLVDQWALEVASLARLLETDGAVVAAHYDGTLGAPVRFAPSHHHVLRELDDAHGAHAWLRAHPHEVTPVAMPEAAFDLDTPEALAHALRQVAQRR